jgi:hypothetical protein
VLHFQKSKTASSAKSSSIQTRQGTETALSLTRVQPGTAPHPVPVPFRMIAGYTGPSQKDSAGDDWAGDQYSHGSWAPHYPTTFIGRTSDPLIFRYGRAGDFSYDIPLKPGLYELHLYFLQTSETDQSEDAENKAVSNVAINRKLALAGFDIVSDAMGRDVADERVIHDVSPGPDGILHLHLSTVVGTPSLSAIKILEGMPHKQFPIRIITQPTSFTDSQWTGVAS